MRLLIALLTLVFVCNYTGLYQWLLGDCCIGMDGCAPSMHCSSANCPGCLKTPSAVVSVSGWFIILFTAVLSVPAMRRSSIPRFIWRPPQTLHFSAN